MQRMPSELQAQVHAALNDMHVPKPAYDIDYLTTQQWMEQLEAEGCNTTEDAYAFVDAAVNYFLCKKCTDAVIARPDAAFNETQEAKRIFNDPAYMPDASCYSQDAEVRGMQEYLLSRQVFVRSWVLKETNNPAAIETFIAAISTFMPRVVDQLAVEEQQPDPKDAAFAKAARQCAEIVSARFQTLHDELTRGKLTR